jgi:PAS domain S-box-containing protein
LSASRREAKSHDKAERRSRAANRHARPLGRDMTHLLKKRRGDAARRPPRSRSDPGGEVRRHRGLFGLGAIIAAIKTRASIGEEEAGGRHDLQRVAARSDAALRELRQSEARFRDIAELAAEVIWETDENHRFTSVAGDVRHIVDKDGKRLPTTLGKTRWELAGADPETDPLWREHKADLDAHRPFRQFRYRRTAPNGARFYFSVSGKPVFDESSRFLGYRGTAAHENAIVEAQERAQQAETLLRDAVHSVSEGFVIYDEEDRLFLCNEAYLRLYPESLAAMVPGTRFEDILRAGLTMGQYPAAKGREEEWLAERMRKHRELSEEHEQHLADGRWVLVSERRMANGGTAGLRIDITALKKIQASLRESREQLNEAQRVSNTGSVVHDFRTNKIAWSDQLYRIFGLRRDGDAPAFDAVLDLVHPEDREHVVTMLKSAFAGSDTPSLQYRIVRPDGTIRWVYREAKINFGPDEKPFLLTSTYKDITEQRLAEERQAELENQLRHSQRLEALGTLAGGIAHDLNNTLVPILALSKLALRLLPADSPVRSDLATIVTASERARDLVRQILAFSRKQELDKQEIDLRAVTREALSMVRAGLPTTIRLIEHLAEVPPVLGDAGQLQQVMVNLVTNAAHAIGDRTGTITVTLGPVAAEPAVAASKLRLTIADTGCGIDAAHLDRIFEPFFTTKSVSEGTGLGLAVVHGIVTGHDGSIEVRSRIGEGTEFNIVLPTIARLEDASGCDRTAA